MSILHALYRMKNNNFNI